MTSLSEGTCLVTWQKERLESERTPTSSGGAKGEKECSTLEGEEKGEQLRDVRFQDKILMKTVR